MTQRVSGPPDGWITSPEADRIQAEAHAREDHVCVCGPVIDPAPAVA
jgi:hypothetical protein